MNTKLSTKLSLRLLMICLSLGALAACDVKSTSSPTGGVDLGGPKACGRGVVVAMTDFKSTNLALVQTDGTTLSGSFLSSGSKPPSLGLALSGDPALPSTPPRSGRIVILDRYGANVITWLDPTSANVLAQLSVATGFESNPQDYLELDDTKAYVTRFESNAKPGQQAFDAGGDVLVLDTSEPAVKASIPMPGEGDLLPRPTAMLQLSPDVVMVVLQRLSADFERSGDSVLVGVSTASDTIAWALPVTGLVNCNSPVMSPKGDRFAMACTGHYDAKTDAFDAAHSDIVVFDATSNPPKEVRRYEVTKQLGGGLQASIGFASAQLLLGKTFGKIDGSTQDQLFSLETESGAVQSLYQATKGNLQLGDVFCSPGCGDICLVADADTNQLLRWSVSAPTTLTPLPAVRIDEPIGLPPRVLGGF